MENNLSLQKIKMDIKTVSNLLFLQQVMIDEIITIRDSGNESLENESRFFSKMGVAGK
jgi:hypothetical protein